MVSPYPLDECVARLKNLEETQPVGSVQSIKVDTIPRDDQICEFRIIKKMYGYAVVYVIGRLTRQEDAASTAVEGESHISTEPQILVLGIGLVGVLILQFLLSSSSSVGVIAFGIALVVGVISWLRLMKWRKESLLLIKKTLVDTD